VKNDKIYFMTPEMLGDGGLHQVKERLKQIFGEAYPWMVNIFSPLLMPSYKRVLREHLNPDSQIVVELGSGERRSHPDAICIDIMEYGAVDIICDVHRLPFDDESIDGFLSWNTLEHLKTPEAAAQEMHRCLKSGGIGIHEIPFLQPFHRSPHDYKRFTHQGAGCLLEPCKVIDQYNVSGPFSLLVQTLSEIVATLFSFGFSTLRAYLYLCASAVLSPFKFLDLPFVRRESFLGIAPSIMTIVRKS